MGCGHAANAVDDKKKPMCAICIGIADGWNIVVESPDLTGRMAECTYGCGREVDSAVSLAFFEHLPEMDYDRYYCGCRGWD